jgi:DNA polymerase (family 10)
MCAQNSPTNFPRHLSNGEIAAELMALAQFLAARGGNPFKVKAYRRAARTIRSLGESIDELVRNDVDLTQFPNIGEAISGAIQEIVRKGTLRQLESIRSQAAPELVELAQHPRLDPRRVLRIYKKLGIASTAALKDKLLSGEIGAKLGARMEQHVRQGLQEVHEMLHYEAETIVAAVKAYLKQQCGIRKAEPVGDYRRRVEIIREISFLVETDNLNGALSQVARYGGRTDIITAAETHALTQLSSGTLLRLRASPPKKWGVGLILSTGSEEHIRQLRMYSPNWQKAIHSADRFATEKSVYDYMGLSFIPPELREGRDEIELAAQNRLPDLVSTEDIRGELHAHTAASDGANTIEEMANAARECGYDYIGISDHSQTLKIANGLSEQELWDQIRFIDELNERLNGVRVLKSAEVDILLDGSLDYPNDLLKELDYTLCSIHSRFGLGKEDQTNRILRAMDNRYFNILGHATGRLLLKRPGYEIDVERVVEHAQQNGCYFEINSSPDRLDLSATNARLAREAGVKVAITTDAHSTREFAYLRFGVDQARRAGFGKTSILNCFSWPELEGILKR